MNVIIFIVCVVKILNGILWNLKKNYTGCVSDAVTPSLNASLKTSAQVLHQNSTHFAINQKIKDKNF